MKQVKPFYKTAAWLKCRADILVRDVYLCQPCFRKHKIKLADLVHHIKALEDYPDLALDWDNLESVCDACHNKAHPEKGGGKQEPKKQRKAVIVKDKANRERW